MIAFVIWPWQNPAKWLIVRVGSAEVKVSGFRIRVKKVKR